MNDIGASFYRFEAKYEHFIIQPIKKSDLKEFVNWPKFHDTRYSWANFTASTKELQERWFKTSVTSKRQWFTIRNPEIADGIIGRCSISQPSNGKELIFGIVLHPDYLNQGIGNICTQMILQIIFGLTEYSGVWLESQVSNRRARRLWEKIGFNFQSFHYRRNNYGRFEEAAGYKFNKTNQEKLLEIEIQQEIN